MRKINSNIKLIVLGIATVLSIISCDALLKTQQTQNKGPKGPKSNPTSETSSPASVQGVGGTVSFTADLSTTSPVQEGLLGFNSAFSFTLGIDKEKEILDLSKQLTPRVLRFPGGTLANYFHPKGPGYGLKEGEVKGQGVMYKELQKQAALSSNALDDYIEYSKTVKHKCLYVANIITGTPDDVIYAINKIKASGTEVIGVELGNELYFNEYRALFPNVQTYINKAKMFAGPIRKAFPEIKIGVIAAKLAGEAGGTVGTGAFADEWNTGLGKETFYDAFIVHTYVKDDNCAEMAESDLQKGFDCEYDLLSPIFYQLSSRLFDPFKKYYGNKKMWFTEWNVKTPKTVRNTFIHASFVTEALMDMNDFNQKNNNVLENSSFHNFISQGRGYGTIVESLPNKPNLSGNKLTSTTSSFYAFRFLADILNGGGKNVNQTITRNSTLDARSFNGRLFYNPSTKKLYLWFVNRSGGPVKIESLGNIVYANATVKYLKADKLYSHTGITGIDNIDVNELMKLENKPFTNNTIDGPLSIGLVEFSL